MSDYILLKWGSLKAWCLKDEKNIISRELLKKWSNLGVSYSAMTQSDTEEQKQIILQIIDNFTGKIDNDWSGENYNKGQAKAYIINYNNRNIDNDLENCQKDLKNGWVEVIFFKSDGSERKLIGTTNFEILQTIETASQVKSDNKKVNKEIVTLYEKDVGWRSFRKDCFLNYKKI